MVSAQAIERSDPQAGYVSLAWGTDAGLPQPIGDLVQTRDGYLWVGTQGGLARFDGVRFTLFRTSNTPALRNEGVQALLEDRAGNLWIGTDRGLVRYREGKFEFVGLPEASILSIVEDNRGMLWLGSRKGLFTYRDGKIESFDNRPELQGVRVRYVFEDSRHRIWIAVARKPALVWENGTVTPVRVGGILMEDVETFAESREGSIWMATNDNGLWRLHNNALKRYGTEEGLGANSTWRVFVDKLDNVWVAAGGLYVLGRGGPDRFGAALPQAMESFRPMCEDREGNLWLGTIGDGLIQVRPTGFRMLSQHNGLPPGTVRTIMEDNDRNLWLAVGRGGPIKVNPQGRMEAFGADEGFRVDVSGQAVGPDGSIWLGMRKGLQVIRNGKVEDFPEYAGVLGMMRDSRGAIWLGRDAAAVVKFQNGQFEQIGGLNGVPPATAVCFAEDSRGAIYLGFSREGMAVLHEGKVTVWTEKNGLPNNDLRVIYPDKEGNVWIGTRSHGLAVFDGGSWLNPPAFRDNFQGLVSSIVEDDHGNVFLGTLRGIFWAPKKEILAMARGGPPAHFRHALLSDGVRSNQVYASTQPVSWKARDGTFWFAMRQGAVNVDPRNIPLNHVPPPVFIETMTADDRSFDVRSNPTLPAGTRTLSIDYTALSYVRPAYVKFRYKLEGHDDRWVEPGARRAAYYSNLGHGQYRFRVVACNNDGVWNEEGASFAFTIQPFFYQTLWFRLSGLVLIAGAAWVGYRFRMRAINRRAKELAETNTELERRAAERTTELARSYETLRASEYFYQSLVESLPQLILRKDINGRITYVNSAFAEVLRKPIAEIVGKFEKDLYPAELAASFREDDERIMRTRQSREFEDSIERNGQKLYLHVKKVPLYDEKQAPIGVQVLFWDMTVFRETEQQLKIAQRELIETSRLAGMAEVATGVLHNIGNALNSVNTSATLAAERIGAMKTPSLLKAVQLILEHRDRLSDFVANDPRGRQLPDFLTQVAERLHKERDGAVEELQALRTGVEHVKEIVVAQQSYAHVSGLTEVVPMTELVESALRIAEASLRRHAITLVREFEPTPPVTVQRQKALQILVNLVNNAKDSMSAARVPNAQMVLRIRLSPDNFVEMEVTDNGSGIAPENLTRIFAFGFTTKKDGHGFGLHSSALAAREMGGSLTVTSPGAGLGATFTVRLPAAIAERNGGPASQAATSSSAA